MESAHSGSTVLMYGTDAFLLETRRLVVASAGYRVSCVLGLPDLEHVLEIRHPDLVILCHSLSPDLQEQACRLVRRISPESRIILLSTFSRNAPRAASVVNCFDGPERLISAMAELASRPVAQTWKSERRQPA
jgi:DNA-binding response OmpR family regulator